MVDNETLDRVIGMLDGMRRELYHGSIDAFYAAEACALNLCETVERTLDPEQQQKLRAQKQAAWQTALRMLRHLTIAEDTLKKIRDGEPDFARLRRAT